ncbi:MAG: NAD(P)H-dependent oxidoreductase [Actinomycetes bacterium]
MTLFRLDSSIRTEGSISRAVADTAEAAWRAEHPTGEIIRRDLGVEPLPSTSWPTAVLASWTPADQHTAAQLEAVALAARLGDELLAADSIIVAVPLYNWGISQHVKAWIDLLITDPRFGSGSETPLKGRSGLLVIARGGAYGEGTPRFGWDHATAYLSLILGEVWGLDLRVVEAELTLAEIVPAMADLKPLAAEFLATAHAAAATHGRDLGEQAAALASV